jgi:hypothetical protein
MKIKNVTLFVVNSALMNQTIEMAMLRIESSINRTIQFLVPISQFEKKVVVSRGGKKNEACKYA